MADDRIEFEDNGTRPYGRPRTSSSRPSQAADAVKKIVQEVKLVADHNGRVYRHDGRCWRRLTEFELNRIVFERGAGRVTSQARRTEIAQLLALNVAVDNLAWGRVASYEVACWSGVLDLRNGQVRPHRPEDYLEVTLPHDFDPVAQSPTLDGALETWFGSADDPRCYALQEFAGYCCMSHARLKKALLLFGPGDTGKGEVLHLLQLIVGREACCALSVDSMEDPVRLTAIRGKRLNLMSELSRRALVRDSGFKTLVSTEEPIFLNPKFEPPELYVPLAKHVIACNELPRLPGRTAEVFNRLLIIVMDRIIPPDQQDHELRTKFQAEIAGIFAWAIRGAKALHARDGRFTEPAGREVVLDGWRRETNPVLDWLDECLEQKAGWRLPLAVAAQRMTERLRHTVTAYEVGKAARELGLTVKDMRPAPGAKTVKCIVDHQIRNLSEGMWSEEADEG